MLKEYGMKEFMEYNKSITYNERFRSIIKEVEITSFLLKRGYKIIEHITAKDMENRYLTLKDGSSAGKVLAGFCIVNAKVL